MLVIPKTMLKLQNKTYMPGKEADIPDALVDKLLSVGLITVAKKKEPKRKAKK